MLGGVRDFVKAGYREDFSFLGLHGEDFSAIEKELQLEGPVEAPVGEGDVFGYLVYTLDGEELGRVAVTAEEPVERAGFPDCLKRCGAVFYPHTSLLIFRSFKNPGIWYRTRTSVISCSWIRSPSLPL